MSVSSISSVPASAVLRPPEPSPPKPPEPRARDEERASQPTVLAALPPGQGTRINQLA
jgi:hypothetical protein